MFPNSPSPITARRLLRWPMVWLIPGVLLTLAIALITLVFNGSVADPGRDLRHAPVGLVNLDQGAAAGKQLNLGTQVVSGIMQNPQSPANAVTWKTFTSLEEARKQIGEDKLWAVVVLPSDYSTKLLSLAGPRPQRPAVTVLTNHGAGTMAASIGEEVATTAVQNASAHVGSAVAQKAAAAGAQLSGATTLLLSDPVTVTAQPGAPLGERTGMGMTAFFYALLLMMAGFLGANLVNGMLDSDLGFGASEVGPKRHVKPPQLISRRATLIAKCLVMAGISLATSTAIWAVSTFALNLDLPHSLLLWVFSVVATSAVGIGTLVVLAALGAPGIVAAMVFFVAAAIPTSSGAIPLQAMPPFWRFLAQFEPQRALSDGVRAIMYFDARGGAGLNRAWITLGIGLVVSLAIGFVVTTLYDRKGLHRMHPLTVARMRTFLQQELHHRDPSTPQEPRGTVQNGPAAP